MVYHCFRDVGIWASLGKSGQVWARSNYNMLRACVKLHEILCTTGTQNHMTSSEEHKLDQESHEILCTTGTQNRDDQLVGT